MGVISNQTYTDGTSVSMVAIRNEYGEPSENVPARPVFRPVVEENKQKWLEIIRNAIHSGKSVDEALEIIGNIAKGDVIKKIATLTDPPLKKARADGSRKPLVDTGLFISSIEYEVK